jgi:four helix bundle protein
MGDFRKLEVWLLAKNLAVDIYTITSDNKFAKDFGLKDQLRRASVSIASNISEGEESGTSKNCIRYFYVAKGSVAEVITQIIIAYEIGYITIETKKQITAACELISKKLYKLIEYRKSML